MSGVDLLAIARERPVHFMGIGGAGMTALAALLIHHGGKLTGCDRRPTGPARALPVPVETGHDPGHVRDCGALVVTAAIPSGHPEIAAAREAGIPVLKRSVALGEVVNRGRVVAVAGTHGKTTTTALTSEVLAACGLAPTGLVGGHVPGWEGNLMPGGDDLFVVEADEFDRAFHTLRPTIAVVTTLEADHLDVYGSLAEVEESFRIFLDATSPDGAVVACADDAGVGRLLPRMGAPAREVVTYGLSAGSMLRAEDPRPDPGSTRIRVRERGRPAGELVVPMPGLHNVRNALAAVAVARHLGGAWSDIREGLAGFAGISRRFEHLGTVADVVVVDDYAHHPTEVAAVIDAARGAFADRRLVAVFQPHLYSRTRDFAAEFGRSLAAADLAVVLDVFPAREEPIPGVDGGLVADAVGGAGGRVHYVEERDTAAGVLDRELVPGDVCLTIGAGDVDEVGRELLELLRRREEAA